MKRPEPPKPRKIYVRVIDVIGAQSTLDLLSQLGTVTSIVPPNTSAGQPYWTVDIENRAWPFGPYGEASITLSTHKDGLRASITAEIVLP